MADTQDFGSMMKDLMGRMPVDAQAMEGLLRSQGALAEKMAAVTIEAAQRSTELSAKWAQDTLSRLSTATQAKPEPTEYAKSVTDFLSGTAEAAAEHVAAFAEIAKKVQSDTIELVMSSAKDAGQRMTDTASRAGTDMAEATRQAQATNV